MHEEQEMNHNIDERARLKRAWIFLIVKIAVIAAAIIIVLTKGLLFTKMSGLDMYPTIRDGDLLMANRLETDYQKGDVVIYEYEGEYRVGRIMGRGTDVIEISEDGTLRVNGTIQESDILFPTYYQDAESYTYIVPEDSYYILGDYRTIAKDSRVYGAISQESIKGKVFGVFRRRSI